MGTRLAALVRHLEAQAWTVRHRTDSTLSRERVSSDRPDLVLIGHGPHAPAQPSCQAVLRPGSTFSVAVVSEGPDEEVERILALETGAEDWLGPDCSPREAFARLRVILRRRAPPPKSTAKGEAEDVPWVVIGEFRFTPDTGSLQRGLDLWALRGAEAAILSALCRQPDHPLHRTELLAAAYGPDTDVHARAVDATLVRLRRLIEPDPVMPRYLQTVRAHGYVFRPQGRA